MIYHAHGIRIRVGRVDAVICSLVGDTGSHGWSEHIFVESSLEILKAYIYHKSLFPIPKVVRISQN